MVVVVFGVVVVVFGVVVVVFGVVVVGAVPVVIAVSVLVMVAVFVVFAAVMFSVIAVAALVVVAVLMFSVFVSVVFATVVMFSVFVRVVVLVVNVLIAVVVFVVRVAVLAVIVLPGFRVHGLDARQAHVNGAINRRAGVRQDAGHREGRVVVMHEAHVADAVRHHDAVAQRVAQRRSHFGAEHRFLRIGERLAGLERQCAIPAVAVVDEVVVGGAQHAVAPVRVAQGERHAPSHFRPRRDQLIALPADVAGGVAHPEHRVEQQIERPATRADHEIDAGNGVDEAGFRLGADAVHGHEQHDAHRHRRHQEARRQAAVEQALPRQPEERRPLTHRPRPHARG